MLNEIATPFSQIATPIANSSHGTNLSGAVNLHLSRSEITQITLESTQSIEIRVKQSEPKILRLVLEKPGQFKALSKLCLKDKV